MSAHQALEHAEHTAHAGGHHDHDPTAGAHGSPKSPAQGKIIGLTMALIGVLIAFCAAMVGAERNELTRTMIEQTQAHSDYSSASTKFRLIMLELEKIRGAAVAANPAAPTPSADPTVLRRFLRLYGDYAKERAFSKEWSDSYNPLVQAHFEGAEGYEHAQLIAEIGIVLASLGVLLGSRPAWLFSVVLAVVCIVQLGRTNLRTRHEVAESSGHVHHGEQAYRDLRKAHTGANEDERTVEALDPGGKLRAENEAPAGAAGAAGSGGHEGGPGGHH